MSKKNKIVIFVLSIVVIVAAVVCVFICIASQTMIVARSKPVIKVENKEFKDLNSNGILDGYEDWRLSSSERADNLISQMSLDEKVGIMYINTQTLGVNQKDSSKTSSDGILDEETTSNSTYIALNKKGTTETIVDLGIRHIIYRTTDLPEDIAKWTNKLNEVAEGTRLGIPVLVTSNPRNETTSVKYNWTSESKEITQYPGTLGLASAMLGKDKEDILKSYASIVKKEWTAVGIRKGYMYQIDVVTDPRWARNQQTFGESTELVTYIAENLTKMLQGESGLNSDGIALTAKHFPGSGARYNGYDSHYAVGKYAPYATENSLVDYHLKPFEAAISAKVAAIMPYYSLPDETSGKQIYNDKEIKMEGSSYTYNSYYLQELLQEYMNFEGYINTDSGVIDYISWGEEETSELERTAKAVNAGCALISDSNKVELLKEAVERGLVTEETLNARVKQLLVEMFDLGLFENPYVDEGKVAEVVANEKSLKEAYDVHLASVTLLKNTNEVLPLKEEKEVKIYFEGMRKLDLGVTEEITNKLKQEYTKVTVVDNITEADYFIALMEPVQNTMENGEIKIKISEETNIKIAEYQQKCNAIHERGGKVITIVNVTSPWILTDVEPYTDALLVGYNTYIKAILDVIFGKYNPTGKLPVTLPASEAVIAIYDEGKCVSPNDVPGYDKNKYMPKGMKYEYVDTENNSYTLGFGLSY